MLQDELNVVFETTEIEITVEDAPGVSLGEDPDVIVVMASTTGPQGATGPPVSPGGLGSIYMTQAGPTPGFSDILKFKADDNGKLQWGNGTSIDTNLYRSAANLLRTDDSLAFTSISAPTIQFEQVAGQIVLQNKLLAADANPAFRILGDGSIGWGPGGASGITTVLSRSTVFAGSLNSSTPLLVPQGTNNWVTLGGSPASAGNPNTLAGVWYDSVNAVMRIEALSGGVAWRNVSLATSGGNVGIGLIGPTAQLHIASNTASPASGIKFGSAGDTTLYRVAASTLQTDGTFQAKGSPSGLGFVFNPATAAGSALSSYIAADVNSRFYIRYDGYQAWGPGGATVQDVILYRASAGILAIGNTTQKGALQVYGAATSDQVLSTAIGANNFASLSIRADGMHTWGTGLVAGDTNLYRTSAAVLQTDGTLQAKGSVSGLGFVYNPAAASGSTLASYVAGESKPRIYIRYDGYMGWGPGGAAVEDTTLFRQGVGSLRTDGAFTAGGNLYGVNLQGSTDLYLTGASSAIRLGPTSDTIMSRVGAGAISVTGPTNTNLIFKLQASGTGSQFLQIFTAGAGPEFQTTPTGDFLINQNGVASGVFQVVKAGAIANTLNLVAGQLRIGHATDTNLYRAGVSLLKTDGGFYAGTDLVANYGSVTNQIWLSSAGIKFGSAADTILYRSAAATLKTDGAVIIGTGLALGGTTPPASGSIKFGDGTTQSTAAGASIGQIMAEVTLTAPFTISTTAYVDAASVTFTADGVSYYEMEFQIPSVGGTGGNSLRFVPQIAGVDKGIVWETQVSTDLPVRWTYKFLPAAGSCTVKSRVYCFGGTPVSNIGTDTSSASFGPGFLRVRKVT